LAVGRYQPLADGIARAARTWTHGAHATDGGVPDQTCLLQSVQKTNISGLRTA